MTGIKQAAAALLLLAVSIQGARAGEVEACERANAVKIARAFDEVGVKIDTRLSAVHGDAVFGLKRDAGVFKVYVGCSDFNTAKVKPITVQGRIMAADVEGRALAVVAASASAVYGVKRKAVEAVILKCLDNATHLAPDGAMMGFVDGEGLDVECALGARESVVWVRRVAE